MFEQLEGHQGQGLLPFSANSKPSNPNSFNYWLRELPPGVPSVVWIGDAIWVRRSVSPDVVQEAFRRATVGHQLSGLQASSTDLSKERDQCTWAHGFRPAARRAGSARIKFPPEAPKVPCRFYSWRRSTGCGLLERNGTQNTCQSICGITLVTDLLWCFMRCFWGFLSRGCCSNSLLGVPGVLALPPRGLWA